MMELGTTKLPVFSLERGGWKAEVIDPRECAHELGSRYVHGGYVRALYRNGECLTTRPYEVWSPQDGEGLPEDFEYPLAFRRALDGEEFLKIGAGKLVKSGRWSSTGNELVKTADWKVDEVSQNRVAMSCRDETTHEKMRFAYELRREIVLHDDGLESISELCLEIPWSEPVHWYAHPFFRHHCATATGFAIPQGARILGDSLEQADGHWHFCEKGTRLANLVGLWGAAADLKVKLGDDSVEMQLDKPLDHIVLFCSDQAASPELKWARAWKKGERSRWNLRYRWH